MSASRRSAILEQRFCGISGLGGFSESLLAGCAGPWDIGTWEVTNREPGADNNHRARLAARGHRRELLDELDLGEAEADEQLRQLSSRKVCADPT